LHRRGGGALYDGDFSHEVTRGFLPPLAPARTERPATPE
jgi:hypothetical protein